MVDWGRVKKKEVKEMAWEAIGARRNGGQGSWQAMPGVLVDRAVGSRGRPEGYEGKPI